ncbi:MAG: hypothetical protein K9M11_01480 [Candidatus Pacebacteria bacterium]|nr:hypothetical protein [Candidatus Paceibacterota bacterium]
MDKLLRVKENNSDQDGEVQVGGVKIENFEVFEGADMQEVEDVSQVQVQEQKKESYFANLGAPRDRYAEEYTPSVILEEKKQPTKMKAPHFKLIPSGTIFEETSNSSLIKYGILALFIGISVTSFITQGVLTIKDVVFGPSASDVLLAEQNASNFQNQNSSQTNRVLADSKSSQSEGYGSDDSLNASSTNINQYRLADEAAFPKLTSTSYLVADLLTGEIIYDKNEGLVAPIASVSKLMTAVIALENLDMQKIAVVSRDAYNTYGGEGELLLGEKIKLYDLMHPLLMESSNDGAEVLAEAYNGGRDAFMVLMNKKAAELGMHNTYYEDPSGLNPKNVSSVEDLLKLGRFIYQKHPSIFDMTHVRQYSILKHTWFNKNRFLTYDTFIGGKNGYIDEAKKTTVSIFDVTMAKGGKRPVVIVLLKSDDREGDAVKLINFLKKNAYYEEASVSLN